MKVIMIFVVAILLVATCSSDVAEQPQKQKLSLFKFETLNNALEANPDTIVSLSDNIDLSTADEEK